MTEDYYTCPICQRKHTHQHMSWHHLLPTTAKSEKSEPRIYICITCHSVIHFCHTNEDLKQNYNTLDKILQSKDIINILELYKYKSDNVIIKIKKLKKLLKCT
jgi:hypothetical protein